jgi:hypothetical protein
MTVGRLSVTFKAITTIPDPWSCDRGLEKMEQILFILTSQGKIWTYFNYAIITCEMPLWAWCLGFV